jgi:hypothetical protein
MVRAKGRVDGVGRPGTLQKPLSFLGRGLPRSINMQKYLIAAVLVVSFTAPVLAVETFYVIFDNTMKGCTIVTTEPTDKARYKILGKYTSNAEAEKAIASMKEC